MYPHTAHTTRIRIGHIFFYVKTHTEKQLDGVLKTAMKRCKKGSFKQFQDYSEFELAVSDFFMDSILAGSTVIGEEHLTRLCHLLECKESSTLSYAT